MNFIYGVLDKVGLSCFLWKISFILKIFKGKLLEGKEVYIEWLFNKYIKEYVYKFYI